MPSATLFPNHSPKCVRFPVGKYVVPSVNSRKQEVRPFRDKGALSQPAGRSRPSFQRILLSYSPHGVKVKGVGNPWSKERDSRTLRQSFPGSLVHGELA